MAKKSLSGVAFKSGPHKGKHKSAVCGGLNSSGKNKGRLKKGFKWTKGSACPVPVAAKPKKKSKAKRRK
jgi:hypothetical protein